MSQIKVTLDPNSSNYIFHIPQEVLKHVPQEAFKNIVDILSKQFIETYGEEIKAKIDKKKLVKDIFNKTGEKMSEEMAQFLSQRLKEKKP